MDHYIDKPNKSYHPKFPEFEMDHGLGRKDFFTSPVEDLVLTVLNDVRVYTRVTVLYDISSKRTNLEIWTISAEQNRDSIWAWPPRRVPTQQNQKVWRDCLQGTLMKGIDDLLNPVIRTQHNCVGHSFFLPFDYANMTKGASLMDKIRQYPP